MSVLSSTVALVALGVEAVALCLLLVAERGESAALKAISKTTASAAFCVVGFVGPLLALRPAIGVGLVLAAVGDLLLLRRGAGGAFLAGLGSFLAAHVAYTVGFARAGLDMTWVAGTGGALLVPAAIVLRWLWPNLSSRMRGPVVAYVIAISAMVACAAGSWARGATPLVLAGAVLFYLSDLFVARQRFVRGGYINRLIGLPLYYLAQALLAAWLHQA
ncbi:MAG: lysoplasmalogenase [Myxococcales bacterium]|nr:lysoplasmalogenase [Myxococcales bacterium]